MPTNFDITLAHMLQAFESNGKCVVAPGSDLHIKFMVMAEEIAALYDKLAFYEKQVFPHTADGEFLQKHGEAKGIFKKTASRSIGNVTFKAKTPSSTAIAIPVGILVASSSAPDAAYRTTEAATLPANGTSVVVSVESTTTGKDTAIAAGLIDLLITPIAGISEVTNTSKISGGADDEPDELYKTRVIEGYLKISNGANLNYYEQLAKSVDDVWYAKAIYSGSPINSICIYVENFTRSISDMAISAVRSIVTTARELGISVTVARPEKTVVNSNVTVKVDSLANEAQYVFKLTNIISDYISGLGIGENVSLAKLGAHILAVDGVSDLTISSPSANITIADGQIASVGTTNITVI